MNRRTWMAATSALCLLGCAGCAPRRTYIVIDAEESVRASTGSLEVIVRTEPDGEPRFRQVFEGEGLALPLALELAEDRSERFTVDVKAYGHGGTQGELVSSRLLAARHGPPRILEVTLDAACREVRDCRADRLEGCVQGQCLSATTSDW